MTDWNKLKVVDLKAELKKRGLAQTGLKPALVERLNESDSQDDSASEATLQDDQKNQADSAAASPSTSSALPASDLSNEVHATDAPDAEHKPDEEHTEASIANDNLVHMSDVQEENVDGQTEKPGETLTVPPAASTANNESSNTSSIEPQDAADDRLKRKRRSQSPPPSAEDIARKRFKAESPKSEVMTSKSDADWVEKHNAVDGASVNVEAKEVESIGNVLPVPTIVDSSKDEVMIDPVPEASEAERPTRNTQDAEMREASDNVESPTRSRDSRFTGLFAQPADAKRAGSAEEDSGADRDIAPAIHPATSALYIKNLMRPLQGQMMQSHISTLAAAPGADTDPEAIVNFYLDPIKTHAFVVLKAVSAASRVRNALHGRIWPDEKTRKQLWVDFVPVEKAEQWIAEEMATNTGPRSQKKWEVDYRVDDQQNVTAVLQEATANRPIHPIRQPAGPGSSQTSKPFDPPSGPRGFQPASKPRADASRMDNSFESTTTKPSVYFKPVSKELANKRLDNIDFALSRDAAAGRRITGDIHRYTFEDGDRLVNRGPEIFSGIRPPPGYRGGRGGRGGPSFRDRGPFGSRDGRRDDGYRENRYDSYRGESSRNDRRY